MSLLDPVDANGECGQDGRQADPGPRARAGLHRPAVEDAPGHTKRHRDAAAGFEVASIEVDPPVISVEGDANDLAGLDRADTLPVSVSGASS